MKKLQWLWFALMCRLTRRALPCNVHRYAVMVRAKKPFFQWVKHLPTIPPPILGSGYGKVYLLPLGADVQQEADFFSKALPYIVLDMLSDFVMDEHDMPDVSSEQTLHQWFEFERIQGVVDYSTGPIRTEIYRF